MEPVAAGGRLPLLLVKPAFAVPTGWAYGRWRDAVALPAVDYGEQVTGWGAMVNDLERPVFAKYVALAELKAWLRSQVGVEAALMSGSGSTVFAVLGEGVDGEALRAAAVARYGEGAWVRLTETVPAPTER